MASWNRAARGCMALLLWVSSSLRDRMELISIGQLLGVVQGGRTGRLLRRPLIRVIVVLFLSIAIRIWVSFLCFLRVYRRKNGSDDMPFIRVWLLTELFLIMCFFIQNPLRNEIFLFSWLNFVRREWFLAFELVSERLVVGIDNGLDNALGWWLAQLDIIKVLALVELNDDVVLDSGSRCKLIFLLHL